MNPRFFEKLEPYGKSSGWLFPRAYNCPYAAAEGISPQSTAGRLLALLNDRGGALTSADGRAGVAAARLLGLGLQSAAPMLRRLEREGYIDRDSNASRVFAIRVTAKGRDAIRAWDSTTDDGLPIFPTTADEWFRELMRDLDMPYTPHCLRHFVATHLYNRKRDWVQLARFLGHSNPAITMGLYANHVVESSQLELAEAAMDLYDDLDVDPAPT
jgi:DNA-binding MarR family transcriptional regulator